MPAHSSQDSEHPKPSSSTSSKPSENSEMHNIQCISGVMVRNGKLVFEATWEVDGSKSLIPLEDLDGGLKNLAVKDFKESSEENAKKLAEAIEKQKKKPRHRPNNEELDRTWTARVRPSKPRGRPAKKPEPKVEEKKKKDVEEDAKYKIICTTGLGDPYSKKNRKKVMDLLKNGKFRDRNGRTLFRARRYKEWQEDDAETDSEDVGVAAAPSGVSGDEGSVPKN